MDAQTIAERVGVGMLADDEASRGLGIKIEAMAPGCARMTMTVRPDMLNGFRICHGGFITLLADSAFAFACNSRNELTVAAGIVVDFVAPAREGDVLTAQATPVNRAGRTGVWDMVVSNQRGERIAVVRGRSYTMRGKPVVDAAGLAR